MDLALLLLALLGHTLVWVAAINRIHAVAIPYQWGHRVTLLMMSCLVLLPVGIWWWWAPIGSGRFDWREVPLPGLLYLGLCWVVTAATLVWWAWRRVWHRPPVVLRWHRTQSVELADGGEKSASGEHAHHFLVRLPGNQILQLDLTERAIDVPRLPPPLEGLSIVHLSDFHFTGRVGKSYFQEVVRRSNQLQPDLVAITGDLVDHADYIDWMPETLGKLTGRYGVYFILGNHDARIDVRPLRGVLEACGMVDLGGRWVQIDIRGEPLVLAGNELPWLPPAADLTHCPPRSGGPMRIVLAHSPDQLEWARAHDADLLLAGHTHGGQIRFPLIGAIFAPSAVGVKYASGVFYCPPTIMHVTRGVSGELPVRLNCPPEIAHLVLHCGK